MQKLQLTIPAQDRTGPAIRIKPREVREWLENLPYLDLQRAASITSQQLRIMNRQPMAVTARVETLGDFLNAWQRLSSSLPTKLNRNDDTGALLKRLCQDICFGYKIIVNDLVNKKAGFIETRQLPQALLGAIYTLGLQLSHYYSHYQRAPRALWSECLTLFRFAMENDRAGYRGELPGAGNLQLDECFRLTALLRQTDPYHLPTGMVAALDRYFRHHMALSTIDPNPETAGDHPGYPLRETWNPNDSQPQSALFLHVDELLEQLAGDIDKLAQYRQAQAIGLPSDIPASTLLHAFRQLHALWEEKPDRKTDREETHARIELVNGLDSAYCMINQGRCFDPALFINPGEQDVIDIGEHGALEASANTLAPAFNCASLNRGDGGVAVTYHGVQKPYPKVGQLVALRRPDAGTQGNWVLAACRWLIEADAGNGFEMGLQYLSRDPQPVVIRLPDETGLGGEYQPAFSAVQKRGAERILTLITRNGQLQKDMEFSLHNKRGPNRVQCAEQLESEPGYERFIYIPGDG
ncbi:hypothetical protein DFR30_1092 [Thiogranum longum]|uniref:GTPase n=1 Tax=Thiogranum longum TaxID=1537524 RepID=A0A4R1HKV8_9GAMM|nr:hypothetical protein [Thiogranum longum]TCK17842.1 hypothetical protein DFR30_1092 [Thiogranum longum]